MIKLGKNELLEFKRSKNIYLLCFFGMAIGRYAFAYALGFIVRLTGDYDIYFYQNLDQAYSSIEVWIFRVGMFALAVWFGKKLYYFGFILYVLAFFAAWPVVGWGVFVFYMARYRALRKTFSQNDEAFKA